MSNFSFLAQEWPDILKAADKSEATIYTDPRTSCFYARRATELIVNWIYKADSTLRLPYRDTADFSDGCWRTCRASSLGRYHVEHHNC